MERALSKVLRESNIAFAKRMERALSKVQCSSLTDGVTTNGFINHHHRHHHTMHTHITHITYIRNTHNIHT